MSHHGNESDLQASKFCTLPIDLCCTINLKSQKIEFANPAFEAVLGLSPKTIIGKPFQSLAIDESSQASLEKVFSKLGLGVTSISFELKCNSKSAQGRWIAWKCYLDSSTQSLYAIGRDVTDYKEVEKLLTNQTQLDQLTGIYSRQTFYTLLQNEINAAARYTYTTAILIVGIDDFEALIMQYGIEKADDCIKQIAVVLKTSLRRKTDFLARFGDNEFAIMLTHNNLEEAIKTGEYLRSNLEKLTINVGNDEITPVITSSVGVTATSADNINMTAESMIDAALRALSVSKSRGGNQVQYA